MSSFLKYIFLYGAVLWAASCHLFEKDEKREVLAKAGKSTLYLEDLEEILIGKQNYTDSIEAIEKYVDTWVKNQILLQKAEYNLGDQKSEFEKQIEQYRRDLLIFAYQQEYLKQNLDTIITDAELQSYYDLNKENFFLKENILIADFAVFPVSVPKKKDLIKNFNSSNKKDIENFNQAALKYAKAFSIDDPSWISQVELAKIIPTNTIDNQWASNKTFVVEDSLNIYFLKINDYKRMGEASPLYYVENTIRSILLNKKKLELQKKLEDDIIQRAYKNDEIEINLPEKKENEINQ